MEDEFSEIFKDFPDCLAVQQLQEMLGVGKNTAYKLLRTGQIKHRKLGRKYLVPKVYVIEYYWTKRNSFTFNPVCGKFILQ